MDDGGVYLGFAFIAFLVALYFVPTLIAISSKARHRSAIILLNLLLGWTVFGWIAALIWTVADEKGPEVNSAESQKKCPRCAEMVRGEAVVCRFCGHEFAGVEKIAAP